MKKMMLLMAGALLISTTAVAKNKMGGGFEGPGLATSTVAEALKMKDDQAVVLKGHIEKALGGDKYSFKDETGTIVVEIDEDDWRGVTVKPDNLVQISGEIDKDWTSLKVDVKSVTLVH